MRWIGWLLRRDSDATEPLGRWGERAAARFLRRKGYKIVARSSRCRLGEVDLVAVDGRTVVFVEVKTRRSLDEDSPAVAVDFAKQQRLTRAAFTFLKARGLLEHASRFDVVAIIRPKVARRPTIEHIINAFEPTGRGQMFS